MLEVGGGLGVLSEFLAPTRGRAARGRGRRAACATALEDAVGGADGVQLHFADALDLDYSALDPRADEGRREPAVRDRGDGGAQVDRGAARTRSCGSRWCSARWASGSRPSPGHEDLRRDVGARAAVVRRQGRAARAADGLPPGAERRVGDRRRCAATRRRRRASRRPGARGLRPPAQGAAARAVAGAGRHAGRPRPRARGARADGPSGRRARRAADAGRVRRGWPRSCAR